MQPITLNDLSTASLDGSGVFDVLMKSMKTHLEQEFKLNRIKGPEYSTVYLGSLTAVLNGSVQFLLSKDKAANDAALIAAQIRLVDAQILQTSAQTRLVEAQIIKQATDKLLTDQQIINLASEALNIPKQGAVLDAQKCKLEAEFDLLILNKDKTVQETTLLALKGVTERAQTSGVAVDADSIVGRQKSLYAAQTSGFARDAEQKAAGVLVDAWKISVTASDSATANSLNKLDDSTVGRVVDKLLSGVNA
jgi:hypothetical protein